MAYLLLFSVFSFGQSKATKSKSISTCHDPAKAVVWQWLMRQDYFDDFGKCSERLETETINLGTSKGFIVRGLGAGLCGATGNCPTWILLKNGAQLKIILNLTAIKTFEIKQPNKKHQPLFLFRYRMGASDHYLSTFRFTGKGFTLLRCQSEYYDIDGKRHISKASRKYRLE